MAAEEARTGGAVQRSLAVWGKGEVPVGVDGPLYKALGGTVALPYLFSFSREGPGSTQLK